MGIHNYHECVLFTHLDGPLGSDKIVYSAVLGLSDQRFQGFIGLFDHDVWILVISHAKSGDSKSCAEAVHIGILVAHYHYPGSLGDQKVQRMSDDPGLALVPLFYALKLASEVLYLAYMLDNCLIAASSKCHIKSSVGITFSYVHGLAAHADSDRKAGGKVRAGVQFSHFVKDLKLPEALFFKVSLGKPKHVFIALDPSQRSVEACCPVPYDLFDLSGQVAYAFLAL